jgi:hypothetical protein
MSDPLQAFLGPIFQARQQVSPSFLAKDNVVACGVGYKIKGDQQTTTPSVVVSVTHKVPADQLKPGDLIPPAVDGVPTDVVETGEVVAFGISRTTAMRPVRPGLSISSLNGPTGTVGCIVRRGDQLFLLSNNHVLGRLNDAKPGDAVIQPGGADGGLIADQVGTFVQYTPITFLSATEADAVITGAGAQSAEPQGCAAIIQSILSSLTGSSGPTPGIKPPPLPPQGNMVDAAIAAPTSNNLLDPNIIDIGAPPQGIAFAKLGMQVFKSGRTSGVTEGIVTQVDVDINVKYDDRVARFTNQIIITPFSKPGDSGSLILDFQRNAVGLLFSGSDLITVATPIQLVLKALDVELVTGTIASGPAPEHG